MFKTFNTFLNKVDPLGAEYSYEQTKKTRYSKTNTLSATHRC